MIMTIIFIILLLAIVLSLLLFFSMKPDKVELVSGNVPLLSSNGVLTCQTVSGFLTTIVHPYFDQLLSSSSDRNSNKDNNNDYKNNNKVLIERFGQCLAVLKLEAAWLAALELDKRQFWLALSGIIIILITIIMI